MVFSSPTFLFLFLPLVLGTYFLVPVSLRNVLLLSASLFFYAWGEAFYVLIMLASIAVNYIFGVWIDRFQDEGLRKLLIVIVLIANLLGLAFFKYANFLVDNLNNVLSIFGIPSLEIGPVHLPIGISFFTFQAMSYVIDVYRKEAPAQKNPINIALYIALFPQLIAGPIVRYHDIAKQLVVRTIELPGIAYGIKRFIIGLGKKVLIANLMGNVADEIFALSANDLSTPVAWLGIIAYSLQIYFDFSGYSDMAIGLGYMFGFKFLENFNYPYISQSITEFWRRWHISLSSWYRDYLYIPLGGNRKGALRTYFNLLTVFILCGIWHGASWSFIIWGLYHGAFLVIERAGFSKVIESIWRPLRHIYVILIFIFGWVFFRAETLGQATSYIGTLLGFDQAMEGRITIWFFLGNEDILALAVGCIAATPILPALRNLLLRERPEPSLALKQFYSVLSIVILSSIYIACVLRLSADTHNPFIYFRF